MLEEAGKVLEKEGHHNVTAVVHDMTSLPFVAGSFDLILCNMGYFEESQKAAHEAFRVLRRGGGIATATWGPLTRHQEWHLLRATRRAAGVHIRGRWVPTTGQAKRRLATAGFVDIATLEETFENRFETTTAYVTYRKSFPSSAIKSRLRAGYFEALLKEAERRSDADGSLTVRWAVTFITATCR